MLMDPVYSVIRIPFYRDVPRRSMVKTAGHLLYLAFLFSLVLTAFLYYKLNPLIHESADWLANSMPAISFADGKATSTLTTPLILRHPRDQRLGILIDTNRTTPVTYEELFNQHILFCLTQNAVYYLNPEKGTLEQNTLANVNNKKPFTLSSDFYQKLAETMTKMMYPIMLPAFWIIFFAWFIFTAVFYSLVGLGINAAISGGLEYDSLYKLAVYAQTPSILLQMILLPRPLPAGAKFLLYLLVTSVYLWQAIRQNAPQAPASGTQPGNPV